MRFFEPAAEPRLAAKDEVKRRIKGTSRGFERSFVFKPEPQSGLKGGAEERADRIDVALSLCWR